MRKKNTHFDDWFTEVLRIATLIGFKEKQRKTIDRDAWRDGYYDEDMTPAEAWLEESRE